VDFPEPTAPQRIDRPAVLSARDILTSVSEVVYEWSIGDDLLRWGSNALDVLQLPSFDVISTGRRYAALLDPDNHSTRYDAVMSAPNTDDGKGVGYQVQYCLHPRGKDANVKLWIEDTGRWFGDSRGKPARAHGVIRVINERHEREQRLAFLSRFDELTGQLNRTHMMEAIEEGINAAKRARTSVGVLIAAIDNLNVINEAYGFDVADEVIALVARRLKGRLRGGDAIGRYSGNKIAILIMNCSEQDMAIAAERFVATIGDEVVSTDSGPISATISVGGVVAPRYARTATEAVMRAQDSLQQVRQSQRSTYRCYSPDPERIAERRRHVALADDIVRGLNERRMTTAYQPIVDARTRRVAFHECLVRLEQADGVFAPASHVVPVAEKLGLIRLVDTRMLELVSRDLIEVPHARVSINVSPQTATDPAWLNRISALARSHPDLPSRLIIEITESAAIRNVDETRFLIDNLRTIGCSVAIDDFGAGYTSFGALKSLSVDLIKIDGGFVRHAAHDALDQEFVRCLLQLSKAIGANTVAEWVEDEATARLLVDWGVDYLQGTLTGGAATGRPWLDPAATNAADPARNDLNLTPGALVFGALTAGLTGTGRI
jgi:diguanylate cyclase (GGDEF)-like protein